MRVLFVTVANKSHIYVAVPLAWALRNAGHEVYVASQPDLAGAITPTGLTGIGVGPFPETEVTSQMNEAEPPPVLAPRPRHDGANPVQSDYAREDPYGEFESLVTNLFPVMAPDSMSEDLVRFAQDWRPDLIIWDMLLYAGPVAAQASGAAHARLLLATDGIGQLRTASRHHWSDPANDPLRAWLQPKLDRFGGTFTPDLALGQWTIDPMPPWTWHPDGVPYLPVRHIPFNGAAMAPRWLYETPQRPRVCITLGNSHRDAGRVEASAADLVSAAAALDVEVVATLSKDQLADATELPDNVRTVDFVPLNVLLRTCSAIVHHGGAGTFAAAVEHGVPQLLVPSPWWSEKWYGPVSMANGVQDRGAGRYVTDADRLTVTALRDSLEQVLADPSYRENAATLRAETLAMPTPNDIVPALEQLTAQYRRDR